ncbi:mannuronate-specific alginate lyase [Spizellomyces sp. 'palustris']|nr:mannuronate-specific alginate lyase [Spizellomyces sp. 'palustris']
MATTIPFLSYLLAVILFATLPFASGLVYPTDASGKPLPNSIQTYYIDAFNLWRNRDLYQSGLDDLNPAVKRVARLGNASVDDQTVYTVTAKNKSQLAPSNNPHDYYSLARYFWPNNLTANGLPYVRIDGRLNPESTQVTDEAWLSKVVEDVWNAGLAWFWTGDVRYADMGVKRLRQWFLDDATKMNPTLEFAEVVKGRSTQQTVAIPSNIPPGWPGTTTDDVWDHIPVGWPGRPAGVARMKRQVPATSITLAPFNGSLMAMSTFYELIDGVSLLRTSPSLTSKDIASFTNWTTAYLQWLQTSPRGQYESSRTDYRGVWYDVQEVSLLLYLNRTSDASQVLRNRSSYRIASAISPNGNIPVELAKTSSWESSVTFVQGLFALGTLSQNGGLEVDLFTVSTSDGRSIQRALDFLYPFALVNGSGWPVLPNRVFQTGEAITQLCKEAWVVYGDQKYQRAVHALQGGNPETWNPGRLWAPYLAIDAAVEAAAWKGVVANWRLVLGMMVMGIVGMGFSTA